jgi:hypothetical protein
MAGASYDAVIVGSGTGGMSLGPATIMQTPGFVGPSLVDIQAEGVDGLYLIGERTSAAKIMGVYGSAQVALEACQRIMNR